MYDNRLFVYKIQQQKINMTNLRITNHILKTQITQKNRFLWNETQYN